MQPEEWEARLVRCIVLVLSAHGLGGCNAQAGETYLGEPLLSLHGQVTLHASTGDGPLVPALCFGGSQAAEPAPADQQNLPKEVLDALADPETLYGDSSMFILDVESHGEFPAEFDVDLYQPPPPEALSLSADGELRLASGSICAARKGHAETSRYVQLSVNVTCADPSVPTGPCTTQRVWFVLGSDRFYIERQDCPTPDPRSPDCTTSTLGDPNLQYEEAAEHVVGVSDNLVIEYLADPAPAGSFTAWNLGVPNGLPAGYHAFVFVPATMPDITPDCDFRAHQAAMDELSAQFGERYDLRGFPFMVGDEEASTTMLPDEVIDAQRRLYLRQVAKLCPVPSTFIPVSREHEVSIHINQEPLRWAPEGDGL